MCLDYVASSFEVMNGLVRRSTGRGDNVSGLVEIGSEERRLPFLDCLLLEVMMRFRKLHKVM